MNNALVTDSEDDNLRFVPRRRWRTPVQRQHVHAMLCHFRRETWTRNNLTTPRHPSGNQNKSTSSASYWQGFISGRGQNVHLTVPAGRWIVFLSNPGQCAVAFIISACRASLKFVLQTMSGAENRNIITENTMLKSVHSKKTENWIQKIGENQ